MNFSSAASRGKGILLLLVILALSGCQSSAESPAGLQLEEHPLQAAPDADSGIFLPVGISREAVLERHREERDRQVLNPVSLNENFQSVMTSLGDGERLTAVMRVSAGNAPRQIVDLMQGDEVIFSIDAGLPSPALPLRSLWTYDNHWVLEILLADEETWQGQLLQDGGLINEAKNYQEAFGFQLLDNKPFFFYQRAGRLGISYDGRETSLPYDQIPHYLCCSASTLNPVPAERMVAFFARTDERWLYVELGNFQED